MTVHVGTQAFSSEITFFYALDKGYFSELGLDVQPEMFTTSQDQIAVLASGKLDVGKITPDAGTFNAIARGFALKYVNFMAVVVPTDRTGGFVVRQDLLDSRRYTEPKDLKGLHIATPQSSGVGEMWLARTLAQAGLSDADVQHQPLPIPDTVSALSNKAFDVVWSAEPFVAAMETQGSGKLEIPIGQVFPGAILYAMLYSPQFAQNPEAANRFMLGMLRAERDYSRAFVQKQDAALKADMLQNLTNHSQIKDPVVLGRTLGGAVDLNGQMDTTAFSEMQDWYVKLGAQTQALDVSQVVDRSYAEAAVRVLGPAQ